MNSETVKKLNVPYLLSYILAPAAVTALCFFLGYTFFHDGGAGAAILFMVPPALSVLWWTLGGKMIFKGKRKKLMNELERSGFLPNHTFDNPSSCSACRLAGRMAIYAMEAKGFHSRSLEA